MFDSQVLAFTLLAALMTVSPGADTLLVVRNALRGGRRDGVATAFGICSGLYVHALLSALGISVLLMHSAAAYMALKIVGAAYLVWLGLQSLRSAACERPRVASGSEQPARVPAGQSWREGFITNVLNPKVVVFYLALLPQFIGADDPVLAKSLLLTAIHAVEGIVWFAIVSFLVDRSRGFFLRPLLRRWIDGLCGGFLVALGVRLALQRQ
jgi:RhtB (resistance to homoserine/threonine) family protein